MDRSYKEDIPGFRAALEEMKEAFSELDSKTDWTGLRIEPLLTHVTRLDQILRSPKFVRETTRLRSGVAMFHADLVYLRTNIKALKEILLKERQKGKGKVQKLKEKPGAGRRSA
jgi:hypothetical protein